MKRGWLFLLCIGMLLTITGCGNTEKSASTGQTDQTAKADAATPGGGKTLVVYFSATGNTKALAQNAAAALNSDIFEIVPEQAYTNEDLNYKNDNSRVTKEHQDASARPAIKNKIEDFAKYDTIVLAYPIWWGQAPNIVETFMESYDFFGKTIVPICTSYSSDIGSSADTLSKLASSSAKWTEGKRFTRDTSKDELLQFFNSQKVGK